jgi:transmembrane sensor
MNAVPLKTGSNPPKVSAQVARQAIEWLVELQSGHADDATKAALAAWLAEHPDHLRAWQHIEQVNGRLASLGNSTSASTVHALLAGNGISAVADGRRRRATKVMLLLATAGGSAWLAHYFDLFGISGEERTTIGQQRTLSLPEGTRVVMGTDTRMRVRYGSRERRIELLQGEIMLTTAPDTSPQVRPLLVATRQGLVQPLGTVFSVRLVNHAARVEVFQQRVRIIPQAEPDHALILAAGQRAELTPYQVSEPVSLDDAAGAWADGMIVAANTRLQDFIEELSRYRRGYLGCAPEVADLRVSGTYPLDDTDRILKALTQSLPLQLHYVSPYWVRLLPTEKKSRTS